jgi:hypothetical protein
LEKLLLILKEAFLGRYGDFMILNSCKLQNLPSQPYENLPFQIAFFFASIEKYNSVCKSDKSQVDIILTKIYEILFHLICFSEKHYFKN